MQETYVIGLDYGTLSGRAVLVRLKDGVTVASSVLEYAHGVMDAWFAPSPEIRTKLPPDWALQHPKDYIEVLENTIPDVIDQANIDPKQVVGLGIDFTARDLQRKAIAEGLPWEMSKCFDHSAAISPEFVSLAEVGAIDNLHFDLRINGEVRQSGNTAEMLFSVDEIISHISQYMTLKIGDLIYTGTPCGVGPVVAGDNLVATLEGHELLNFDIR